MSLFTVFGLLTTRGKIIVKQVYCQQLSLYLSTSINIEGIWKSCVYSATTVFLKKKDLFMKDNSDLEKSTPQN